MTYTIKLNDQQMSTLLSLIKYDFAEAYNDNDEPKTSIMEEDIDLLRAASYAFKNENAKMQIDIIIADYERKLNDAKR